mmetsp:Transcript_14128/g.47684  ORF Transcript_14128/g.47684 Transcript_14128/m.47684 type:complete len:235 (-) Transcript_14128:50-754(-)
MLCSTDSSLSEGTKCVAIPACTRSAALRRAPVMARNCATPGWGICPSHTVLPTSGKRPMAVSGMAKSVFSVATRYLPWTDMPTPPPMTIPSHRETCGTRLVPNAWFMRYSWRKKSAGMMPGAPVPSVGLPSRPASQTARTSPPAQKAFPPAPLTMNAPTSLDSPCHSSSRSRSWLHIPRVSELSALGRERVTRAVAPRLSTTSSGSPTAAADAMAREARREPRVARRARDMRTA